MKSDARSVPEYLAALPDDRRDAIEAVRNEILTHLPDAYEEGMQYGMIGYYVPLARYPDTYNGQPLSIAGLANQKRYMALYLMGVYADPGALEDFKAQWTATGNKLDMGKSCVRFTKLEAVPLAVVGATIARTSVADLIAAHEQSRR